MKQVGILTSSRTHLPSAEYLLRSLTAPSELPSDRLKAQMERTLADVKNAVRCKCCYLTVDIVSISDDCVDLGLLKLQSRDLARRLSGSKRAVVFAATLGAGIDRLIAKSAVLRPAEAYITDAIGLFAIEDWCDEIERLICPEGEHTDRYSPGYGDLSISVQKQIIQLLSAPTKIGLALSESLLMIPSKSVTAIFGIK